MNLAGLISRVREIFANDKVDVDEVRRAMESYKSNPADWRHFAQFDPNKYTRNLVDTGNGKYNLMLLCWGPSMASAIHDHTDAHCFVKILDGSLVETKYEWPKAEGEQLHVKESTVYDTNGVSYMSDMLGLHRMENPSHFEGAVSLHLYIPPYTTCNAFDERTGHKTKCTVTFYTKYGCKVDYSGSKDGKCEGEELKEITTSFCYATPSTPEEQHSDTDSETAVATA